jgi:hypothetical protein
VTNFSKSVNALASQVSSQNRLLTTKENPKQLSKKKSETDWPARRNQPITANSIAAFRPPSSRQPSTGISSDENGWDTDGYHLYRISSDENGLDTDGYHLYRICFYIYVWIQI